MDGSIGRRRAGPLEGRRLMKGRRPQGGSRARTRPGPRTSPSTVSCGAWSAACARRAPARPRADGVPAGSMRWTRAAPGPVTPGFPGLHGRAARHGPRPDRRIRAADPRGCGHGDGGTDAGRRVGARPVPGRRLTESTAVDPFAGHHLVHTAFLIVLVLALVPAPSPPSPRATRPGAGGLPAEPSVRRTGRRPCRPRAGDGSPGGFPSPGRPGGRLGPNGPHRGPAAPAPPDRFDTTLESDPDRARLRRWTPCPALSP